MIAEKELIDSIRRLSPESVAELRVYVDFLRYRERQRRAEAMKTLYDAFAPVREAVEASRMTEEEVNQIIDEAIAEVRPARVWRRPIF